MTLFTQFRFYPLKLLNCLLCDVIYQRKNVQQKIYHFFNSCQRTHLKIVVPLDARWEIKKSSKKIFVELHFLSNINFITTIIFFLVDFVLIFFLKFI